jgi:lipopolysaccharide assembly protein A
MARIISWLIAIPAIILVIAFSIANRETVSMGLWPLPYQLDAPLFAIMLAGVFVGFLWGAVVVWVSAGKLRRKAKTKAIQAQAAERELAFVKDKISQMEERQHRANIPALAAPQTPSSASKTADAA